MTEEIVTSPVGFKVATLMLYNDDGKILLEHRAEKRKRHSNVWGFFGGLVNEGETPEEGMRREIKEELGYDVRDPKLLFAQQLPRGTKYVYIEKYDNTQSFTLDSRESQGYGWFTLDEALQLETILHDNEPLHKAWGYVQANR